MKKFRKLLSVLLSVVLIMSTFGGMQIQAATDDTRYSDKKLQNGSFEENAENYKFSANYVQPTKTDVPYWDTTAYETNGANGKLEFFRKGSAHFNQTTKDENKDVADGKIAAELNANEVSTIYQRINTVSGSTYTWGLDHRGRDTTDTMVLFIGPEQYADDGTAIDPSKPKKDAKDGSAVYPDQFVRITNWLKTQYGVTYPDDPKVGGCSQKYTVYTRPFAEKGRFKGEPTNTVITNSIDETTNEMTSNDTKIDQYVSMTQTEECNQEWNLWVISSVNNNESDNGLKGWSKYGTNCYDKNDDKSYNDVIKGEDSELGYDCTYTVPKGQTETLFAFTSYSGNRKSGSTYIYDATYGNLLDDINFKLYQPISSSITEGGNGGVENGNAIITTDIQNGSSFFETVNDGELCYIHTQRKDESDTYKFQGAYVTIYSDDGTPTTKFVPIYPGSEDDFIGMGPQEKLALAQQYFIPDGTGYEDAEGNQKYWDYVFAVSVESPVHIHMMYTKAPFILYDSNGGVPYEWTEDNSVGGNLVGFRDGFKGLAGVDSKGYYEDVIVETIDNDDGTFSEKITPGFYKSHAALPNESWNKITFEDGSVVGSRFVGWAITDTSNKQVILDGNHTATYAPDSNGVGNIKFTDASNHNVDGLILDATHGVTLIAQWQFGYTAQTQTLLGHALETQSWENSDVGGWVEETYINDRSNVKDHQNEGVADRTERTDAYGSVGEKIIFRATPDSANDYVFDGWYTKETDGKFTRVTTAPILAITVEEGKSTTYYARFKTKTVPVIFHYSESGSKDNYVYYDADANNKYGKYFQEVVYNENAVKPTGDSKKVSMWFTSPTERSAETVFNFNTPITKETHLYASPSFTFNYFNYFVFQEPWRFDAYATLKFNGSYIDLKNDADISDYNVYMLKGTLNEATPSASSVINNSQAIKVGKNSNSESVIFNTTTNTGKTFNRAGSSYDKFYLFNMKTPVWVVFDFTYKGIKYTSAVKDKCLYNNITTYMQEEKNGFYTSFPPETQAKLRTAQTTLLNSIQAMYNAVSTKGITEPSQYADSSAVSGLTYDSTTDKAYNFTSTTAIRNIEPWGLKYTFSVDNNTITDFEDYGAVVLTDKNSSFDSNSISVDKLLDDENSVMYSKSNNNIYTADDGSIEVYYINNMLATDFDKNTYVTFFVKKNGVYYYSDIVSNSYKSLASADTSEDNAISQSINDYSTALTNYYALVESVRKGNA